MPSMFPDVANFGAPPAAIGLARVGMSEIQVPVRIEHPELGQHLVMGRADAYVSLDDPNAKGIHMSRLFLKLNDYIAGKSLSYAVIEHCVRDFVSSHKGLSKSGYLNVRFELPLVRHALKSENSGWRAYPISLTGELNGDQFQLKVDLQIAYSSTCPCSAALARQLVQERFVEVFGNAETVSTGEVGDWLTREDAILATPHGQRSHANVTLVIRHGSEIPNFIDLINDVEAALGTPVQAAVKRADEQEFARLNGSNLMFAEDAARKAATALENLTNVDDYRVEVIHFESLHPHNAVAVAVKGVEGGLQA